MSDGAIVLGSDYKALGVVRSLGRRGIAVWVVRDEHRVAAASRYCKRSLTWRHASERGRTEQLRELAESFALRGWSLFATDEETAAFLARNRATLMEHYRVGVPAWDVLRWAYDKRLAYRLADDASVDRPMTLYPRSRSDLEWAGEYPAILKPAIRPELNPFTIAKAWRVDDAASLARRYEEACAYMSPDVVMVQELIPGGGEYQLSYAALCREGKPLASLVARRTRQWPMDFGRASTLVETVEDPEVEVVAERFLAALRFDGIVEVEFKRDPRDGRLKLLDVNPRFWGWHSLSGRAGVDFPFLLWRAMHGDPPERVRGRPGVRWVRALTDVPTAFHEMRARRLSPWAYLWSLRPPVEWAVLAMDDIVPALIELPASLELAWRRRDITPRDTSPEPGVVASAASARER